MKFFLWILVLFWAQYGFAQQKIYILKSGDTLYSIAKKNGISVAELKAANPSLQSDDMRVGAKIMIPYSAKTTYYTVKAGDTLYKISKENNLSVKDLIRLNPTVDVHNLKIGQMLKLASFKEKSTQNPYEDTRVFNQNMKSYVIKKGDTFYSLSKTFHTDIETLRNYNPWWINGLKVGQKLYFPPVEDGFITHTVKKGETIFSITRQYNTTLAILLMNNHRLNDGLKKGMLLKIPVKSPDATQKELEEEQKRLEKIKYADYTKVVYILPFNARHYETTKSRSLSATEFYMGSLFALDSLTRKGRKILVKTFDNKGDIEETKNILRKINSMDADLIIGPLRSENVHWVADHIKDKNIKIISPFSSNVSVAGRGNLIKTNLSRETIIKQLSDKIKAKNSYNKIYLIGNEDSSLEIDLKKYFGYSLFDKINSAEELDSTKISEKSTFILNTATPDIAQKALKKIHELKNLMNKKTAVIALGYNPAYIKGYGYNETYLGHDLLSDIHLTVVIPHYFDDNKPAVYEAKLNYKIKNKAFPDSYSSAGFDWTYYMLLNNAYQFPANHHTVEGLFNKIALKKIKNGGYVNKGIFIINY